MTEFVGQTIKGRYYVETTLGRGGMAEVFKVWDKERAAHLALKLLRDDMAEDPVFLRRFKREAHTLSKLQHPNVVRFYGMDQEGARAFILMDFVNGATLRSEIFQKHGQGLSLSRILEIMKPVCSALHFAHRKGFIHCDLKPANIMLDQSGRILLADFGIARAADGITATMIGAGTPAYMAPELARGEEPTPFSDIYALGVVLFEMLTGGERPFTGEHARTSGSTFEKVRWEQTHLPTPSVRTIIPSISIDVDTVILRCLNKNPSDRFSTPLELLNSLALATGGISEPSTTLIISGVSLPSTIEPKTAPVITPLAIKKSIDAGIANPGRNQKKSSMLPLLFIGLVFLFMACLTLGSLFILFMYLLG